MNEENMSNRCKLIIVEGIPGSGKTSTARFIQGMLDEAQIPNELYLEGNLDHPADYEGVAWLPAQALEAYLQRNSLNRTLIDPYTWVDDEDGFIAYRKLERDHREAVSPEVINFLSQHDVYEVPTADLYCRLALKRWKTFAEEAERNGKTYVFECCLIQNPLAVLMLHHNMSEAYALGHIRSVIHLLEGLNPTIVYFWQKDTRAAFDKITQERPKEWMDFVIAYTESGKWSKANGQSGYEGVVKFYDDRKQSEMRLLHDLGDRTLLVENTDYDWARCRREITKYIINTLSMSINS